MNSSGLFLHNFGTSPEVRIEGFSIAEPAAGEIRVAMQFSPINPADLNVLEGKYGQLPELPAVIGSEGCGVVEAVGEGVTDLQIGDTVISLRSGIGLPTGWSCGAMC